MTITAIISLIISGLALLGAIIGVWVALQNRITTLEVKQSNTDARLQADTQRYEHFKTEMRSDINKLYEKIDEVKDLIINLNKH